jgi:hypothetical protein
MKNTVIIEELNKNNDNSVEVTNEILGKLNIGKENLSTLKFIFHELIANIYDHSNFKKSFIIGKSEENYFEFAFMDNGITIPQSLKNHNFKFKDDCDAIIKAANGLSTKNEFGYIERGTGLNNSINIVVNGSKGSFIILSKGGLIYIYGKNIVKKELPPNYINGTIILLKMKLDEKIDIYKYLKQIEIY